MGRQDKEDEIWSREEQCICKHCWELESPTLVNLETSRLHLETFGSHPDAENVFIECDERKKRKRSSQRKQGVGAGSGAGGASGGGRAASGDWATTSGASDGERMSWDMAERVLSDVERGGSQSEGHVSERHVGSEEEAGDLPKAQRFRGATRLMGASPRSPSYLPMLLIIEKVVRRGNA